jgi:hypothetical protein
MALLAIQGFMCFPVRKVGKTPMDLAVEQQHAAIVPLLNASTAAQLACPELLHVGELLPGQQQTLQPLLLPIQQGLTLVHCGSRSAH